MTDKTENRVQALQMEILAKLDKFIVNGHNDARRRTTEKREERAKQIANKAILERLATMKDYQPNK